MSSSYEIPAGVSLPLKVCSLGLIYTVPTRLFQYYFAPLQSEPDFEGTFLYSP